jgi:hypothetical protein
VGGDGRFIDKNKVRGIKQPLLAHPASARPSHVGSLTLFRLQAFFLKLMPWRAKKRERALRLVGTRRLYSAETISPNVRSGCSRTRARIHCECSSNGEVLPPRGIGSQIPSSRKRCTHLIAELTLTSNCSAASCRDPPFLHKANDSHSQLTRIRSMHWTTLRRINALDSLLHRNLGIPIHSGRDVL